MRVAHLTGLRQFQVVDTEIPAPGPGEVQVRVRSVGICGSDLHNFAEGGVGDAPCVYPMVIGHEPSGEVVSMGTGVTGWAPGDRAMLEPAIYCYHCEFCMSGRHNVCANLRFLSTGAEPGFFRERVNLPAGNLIGLPPSLNFDEGTLFEPLAIVLHSMKFARPKIGETAVVFGAGPIGLLTALVLKLSGIGRLWVVEPVAHRREMALAMGADAVLDPAQEDVVRRIKKDTGNRGVDFVIDCAAKDGTMNQSLRVSANGGRVVYTAIPGEVVVPIEMHEVRRKELVLYNVRRSNHDTDLAVKLMLEHGKRLGPLLSHRRPMERIQDAFDMLEQYADGAVKITIQP